MTFWTPTPDASVKGLYRLETSPPCFAGVPGNLFLMGGVGLATAMDALQQHTGQPVLWITAQFLATAFPGATLDIDVETPVVGRRVTHAGIVLREGARVVHRFMAATSASPLNVEADFIPMPSGLPTPLTSVDKDTGSRRNSEYLLGEVERRLAYVDEAAGIEHVWCRSRKGRPMCPELIAIISDFSPSSHPKTDKATSIDNTFRMHRMVETEWVLVSTQVHSFADETFHNLAHVFAEDGTLMATASQTGLRPRPSRAQALANS